MKNDLFTLICMTLVCATVMFGVMGIYKLLGNEKTTSGIAIEKSGVTTAFKIRGVKGFF